MKEFPKAQAKVNLICKPKHKTDWLGARVIAKTLCSAQLLAVKHTTPVAKRSSAQEGGKLVKWYGERWEDVLSTQDISGPQLNRSERDAEDPTLSKRKTCFLQECASG